MSRIYASTVSYDWSLSLHPDYMNFSQVRSAWVWHEQKLQAEVLKEYWHQSLISKDWYRSFYKPGKMPPCSYVLRLLLGADFRLIRSLQCWGARKRWLERSMTTKRLTKVVWHWNFQPIRLVVCPFPFKDIHINQERNWQAWGWQKMASNHFRRVHCTFCSTVAFFGSFRPSECSGANLQLS